MKSNAIAGEQAIHIIELLPDAVLLINKKGQIKYTNSVVTELFGYLKAELFNNTIDILLPDRFKNNHSKHRSGYFKNPSIKLMSTREELFGLTKNGVEIPVEISLGPIEIKGELYVICILRETSSRHYIKMLESKNQELEEFTYAASHDLQEPLRTLTSFTEILTKELSNHDNNEIKTYLKFINTASQRMSDLVKALLDYGRLGRKKELSDVNCTALLKAVISDLDTSITKNMVTFNCDELPIVKGYAVELRLLFQNLISNAIKFKKPNKNVTISISCIEHENTWQFCISDNGIGIAEKNVKKIFVLFKRLHLNREYEGLGIGLANCQKIVNLHQGKIWVDSKLDIGSSFYFTIQK